MVNLRRGRSGVGVGMGVGVKGVASLGDMEERGGAVEAVSPGEAARVRMVVD